MRKILKKTFSKKINNTRKYALHQENFREMQSKTEMTSPYFSRKGQYEKVKR
jgi:hypothetical protein